jgi:hypothetical protein
MNKSLIAVIFAAGCAAVFVGIVPPPTPAAAAIQTDKPDVIASVKSDTVTLRPGVQSAGCVQPWPYYEASCVRDSRRHSARTAVRMITLDKPAGHVIKNLQR